MRPASGLSLAPLLAHRGGNARDQVGVVDQKSTTARRAFAFPRRSSAVLSAAADGSMSTSATR